MCARWLQAHGELGINIPEEHDSDDEETEDKKRESIIKDTTEGLYVISKMLLSDSRESRMLLRRGRDTPEEVCHKLFPDVCKKERSRDVKPSIVTLSASASATESGPPCHADQTNEEEEDYIEFAGVRKRGSAAISMQDKRTGDDSLDPRELIISAVQQSSSSSSTARSSSPAPFSPSDVKSSHSGCIAAHGTMDTPCRDLYDEDGNIISAAAAAAVTSPQERNMKEDMKKRKRAVDETVTDSFADGSNSSSSSSSSSFSTDSSKGQTVDKVDPPCNSSKPMSPSASALASAPVPVPVEFTEAALLMKESLSHHLHMYQGALIDFIPSRGAGKKRGGRLPLLPVSKVVHCGDCGSMGESAAIYSVLPVVLCPSCSVSFVLCYAVLCCPVVSCSVQS